MKCIKNKTTNKIKRVKDSEAEQLVNSGSYVYIPKHVWKSADVADGGRKIKGKKTDEMSQERIQKKTRRKKGKAVEQETISK